jgi:hypothetical protein
MSSARGREHLTVLDFGAKGDGVTDDSAAFIAAMASGAGVVRVPGSAAGYVIGTTVPIAAALQLKGEGRAARIIPAAGFAGPIFWIKKTAASTLNLRGQAVGVRFKDIWMEDPAFRSQATDGILVTEHDEVAFDHVMVRSLKGYALKLGDSATGKSVCESRFMHCIFWDCGNPDTAKPTIDLDASADFDELNGIYFHGGGVKFPWHKGVHIRTNSGLRGARHVYFSHFHIEGREGYPVGGVWRTTVPAPYDLVHIAQADNVSLTNCQLSACGQGKACVQVDGSAGYPVRNVVVDQCVVGGGITISGVVDTDGTTVTWISGTKFHPDAGWPGMAITINGVAYTISSVTTETALELTATAGAQTGVAYSLAADGYGVKTNYVDSLVLGGNHYLVNPLGRISRSVNTLFFADHLPAADTGYALGTLEGVGSDLLFRLRNKTASGQAWNLDSKSDGGFSLTPESDASKSLVLGGQPAVQMSRFRILGLEGAPAVLALIQLAHATAAKKLLLVLSDAAGSNSWTAIELDADSYTMGIVKLNGDVVVGAPGSAASVGSLRFGHGFTIYCRDAAGTGDALLLSTDASDRILLGNGEDVKVTGKLGAGIEPLSALHVRTGTDQNLRAETVSGALALRAVNDDDDGTVVLKLEVSALDVNSVVQIAGNTVLSTRAAAIANPSGGAVQDAEARSAINSILAGLRHHGLIAT